MMLSLPEAVTSELRVLVAAARSLSRRPLEPLEVKPGWRRFGAMQRSSYGNIVAMLWLLIALEAPAVHLILGAIMVDGALRGVIRTLLLATSIYLALWLLGDLRLLRETPGVLLGDDVLVVEMGVRVQGTVALAQVTGAQLLGDQAANPSAGSGAIRITPQPPPNCRIRLSSPARMRGLFGIPLRGELLDIYVDDPAGLVGELEFRRTLTPCA